MPDPAGKSQVRTDFAYDEWMESQGVPIYRGHFVPDMRTVPLGYWKERECDAAFVQLVGQQGVSEARITEIPPGESLPPYRMAVEEVVYVVSGTGSTRVWSDGDSPDDGQLFEWHDRALFLIPGSQHRQFSNLSGDTPVRLLHYDYLPLAMSVIPDPDFFFQASYRRSSRSAVRGAYSEAELMTDAAGLRWVGGGKKRKAAYWYGNFFPDMQAWDKMQKNDARGAGGSTVLIQFAGSDMSCHMSMFDAKTYKKAHRHGPGRVIVVPTGEGYSVMWPEGGEKTVVQWQEAALFVPPDRWFHQHFNLGDNAARYLALHPPMQFHGYAASPEERAKDQIEYPQEEPWVREMFERELAAQGLKSLMPDEVYTHPGFTWK
jgi:hypothetical protein